MHLYGLLSITLTGILARCIGIKVNDVSLERILEMPSPRLKCLLAIVPPQLTFAIPPRLDSLSEAKEGLLEGWVTAYPILLPPIQ